MAADCSTYARSVTSGVARGGHMCMSPVRVEKIPFLLFVLYFKLFSVRFFDCYLWLLGSSPPRPSPGLCPWTPLGDFRPPDLLYVPINEILSTPLSVTILTTSGGVLVAAGRELDDVEQHVARIKPEGLDVLCRDTKFTRKELQIMYRGFKQVLTTGPRWATCAQDPA